MNENSEDNVSRGSAPDHDRAGSLGELIRVALPLVLSAGSHSMMSAADRMILTGYSADALAAVTPASMLHWTSVCIPLGTILYANTFIAQFDGAGRKDRMIASLWQSVWLAIISGILLPVCLLFSRQVFALTGQPTAVVEQETIYFNALCLGSVFLLGSSALSCFFSGRQRTSVVMWVSMMGVVLNFVMDYVLVFGIGPFPMMGIRGAAVATVLARCCEILVYQYLIRRELRREEVTWSRLWLPDRSLLLQYLRFGVPSGLHYFVDNSGFTAFLLIVGSLGRDALAATNLAFSVNGLIFVPLLGFGTAVQTLVGHHIGARKLTAAAKTAWKGAALAGFWTGCAALMLVLSPRIALKPFFLFAESDTVSSESVESLTSTIMILLQFVAIYSVFDAFAVVFSAALRGAGDTLFPMGLTMASSWLVMVLPSWWLASQGQGSLSRYWTACSLHVGLSGGLMFLRFLSGRWKSIRIVD